MTATPEPLPELLKRINLVHPTELGTPLVEHFIQQLRSQEGLAPSLVDLTGLAETISQAQNLDSCVEAIRSHDYFRSHMADKPAMLWQIRNAVPADVSVIYRSQEGQIGLESMFQVSHADPNGRLITDSRICPAAMPVDQRPTEALARRSYDLHELASPAQLMDSHTYQVIFDDLSTSWHVVVLDRDHEFTWALYFWYSILDPEGSVSRMRSGFERIAEALGEKFLELKAAAPGFYKDENSLLTGRLVFRHGFADLFRQNYCAEAIMQGLGDHVQVSPTRAAIYRRIDREYHKRLKTNAPLSWQVNSCFHPVLDEGTLRVSVREVRSFWGQLTHVELEEEAHHRPYLPQLPWWDKEKVGRDGIAKTLLTLGQRVREPPDKAASSTGDLYDDLARSGGCPALYHKSMQAIARPVWDIDLVGNRLLRYAQVPAGAVGRPPYTTKKLQKDRLWAITYYGRRAKLPQIVGVLHAKGGLDRLSDQ